VRDDHLTEPDPVLAKNRRLTVSGMAHWGGTGPKGTTCGGCGWWGFNREQKPDGWMSHRCGKYEALTGKRGTARIELHQPSCRHFVEITPAQLDARRKIEEQSDR